MTLCSFVISDMWRKLLFPLCDAYELCSEVDGFDLIFDADMGKIT